MQHLQETKGWKFPMRLRDLFETFNENPQDVDLYHWDYDEEYPTMCELSMNDFTESGLEEFRVALDMEVMSIQSLGENYVSVGVNGAHRSHVENLSISHAGYCSEENYKLWFTMDD